MRGLHTRRDVLGKRVVVDYEEENDVGEPELVRYPGTIVNYSVVDGLTVHECFAAFDIARDGGISLAEFCAVARGMRPPLALDKPTLYAMFSALVAADADAAGADRAGADELWRRRSEVSERMLRRPGVSAKLHSRTPRASAPPSRPPPMRHAETWNASSMNLRMRRGW